ncbi:probable E3 ubiquitin-protein ligase XERICO isoform X1 [Salvia hispanica]|uniref:probable E3 ubiquitin-protein ligase XERICO isoform X1 n=2 Tax=Salvia hispanica TaxID=49212 RepID=UPI002009142C|nr:probable E3 ubiquitin-protein ligase XERICO isoform X1 [Salvia hispanica]
MCVKIPTLCGSHHLQRSFSLFLGLKMAISSYPTPADAGVLCVILANTAISISIFKEMFRSILNVIGINISSWEDFTVEPSNSGECCRRPSELYVEEFRSHSPSMQYESVFFHQCPKQECSICLTEFVPKAEINQLSCGHVFHKACLEKWLNYWNTTCPLCRNYMMPQEAEEDASCPM